MNQGTVIFGVVLFAFLVFITVRGELPDYMRIIGLTSSPAKK